MATADSVTDTIVGATESAASAVRDAQASAEQTISEVIERGSAMVEEARDAWDDLDVALRRNIRERPYAALVIAGGLGFLYAVARR